MTVPPSDDRVIAEGGVAPSAPFPDRLEPEFFVGVVESSPDPYVIVDLQGTIRWASRAAAAIVGLDTDAYVGRPMTDFLAPASLAAAVEAFSEYSSPGRLDTGWIGPPLPIELLHRDGSAVPCEIRRVPSPVPLPGVVLTISTSGPMISLYEAIERIVADAPLDDVMASIVRLIEVESPYSIPVIALGWDGEHFATVAASTNAPTLDDDPLPFAPDGRTPWQLLLEHGSTPTDDDLTAIDPRLRDAAETAGATACWVLPIEVEAETDPFDPAIGRSVVVLWRRAPGRPRLNVLRRLDRIRGLIGLALSAAHSKRQLRRAARTDAVTGLPNRLALGEHFDGLSDRPGPELIGVLYCDLDHFKAVNDEHGHPTGDRVLRIAADRMRSRLRSDDVVARVGGDEFVVVTRTAHRAAVAALAERLLSAFDSPIVLGDLEVPLGMSIGVASAPAFEVGIRVSGEELVERADRALLDAKATGKHRVVWADDAAPPSRR